MRDATSVALTLVNQRPVIPDTALKSDAIVG